MTVRIITGDCRDVLKTLPDESVHCVVTSPPYWGLRDYGVSGQMGLETTPAEFVAGMVGVFAEVRRVLRADGTLWLNLGDSYAGGGCGSREAERWPKQSRNDHMATHAKKHSGLKTKDLVGAPWRVAFALQADGWYLRSDIIWSKPNPMPEGVTDRPTKAHEYIFLLSKSERYFYDAAAIREPLTEVSVLRAARANTGTHAPGQVQDGRNKRTVWEVATQPFSEAHFATFPPALIEPCILAGCPRGGVVLDPFGGAGTTGLVADRLGRDAVLIELNPAYAEMGRARIGADAPLLAKVAAE